MSLVLQSPAHSVEHLGTCVLVSCRPTQYPRCTKLDVRDTWGSCATLSRKPEVSSVVAHR